MQNLLQELLRLAKRNSKEEIFIRKTDVSKYFDFLHW